MHPMVPSRIGFHAPFREGLQCRATTNFSDYESLSSVLFRDDRYYQ